MNYWNMIKMFRYEVLNQNPIIPNFEGSSMIRVKGYYK